MTIRTLISRFTRFAAAALAISLGPAAHAQMSMNPNSPVGLWELKISGRIQDEAIRGNAFVTFSRLSSLNEGDVEGYCLLEGSTEVQSISGFWREAGRGFEGAVFIDGVSDVTLEYSGRARTSRSLSARLTDETGDRVSLAGKFIEGNLPNMAGTYVGTARGSGTRISVQLTLTNTSSRGEYEIMGRVEDGEDNYEISGVALIGRRGNVVAYVSGSTGTLNLTGRIRPGVAFSGTGFDSDGDRVQLRLRSNPGF